MPYKAVGIHYTHDPRVRNFNAKLFRANLIKNLSDY